MTFTLDSIQRTGKVAPPRIIVHGPRGIGKTTLASQAPAPVFIRTEDGMGKLSADTFPIAKHFLDVMGALKSLGGDHKYKTVVIDSLDWLEPLIWDYLCFENHKSSIEDWDYGKGFTMADKYWREFFDALTTLRDQRGLTILCLAHTDIKRFDAPDAEPYDRYVMKMHKRATAIADEWADVIGFARYEVITESTDVGFKKKVTRGIGTGSRLLALEERPAFDAKNRYGLPPEIELSWAAFRQAMKDSLQPKKAPTESNGAVISDTKEKAPTESNGAVISDTKEPANV